MQELNFVILPHLIFEFSFQIAAQKIVGGEDAEYREFPWLVLIGGQVERNGEKTFANSGTPYTCGGSLISDFWVLTAAHCTHDARTKQEFAGYKTC